MLRLVFCIASLIGGLLAGTVGGADLADRWNVGYQVPLAIAGAVCTGLGVFAASCLPPKPPDDPGGGRRIVEKSTTVELFGWRWARVYRELVFIGVLFPIVFGDVVRIGSWADLTFWLGTGIWLLATALLLVYSIRGTILPLPARGRSAGELR